MKQTKMQFHSFERLDSDILGGGFNSTTCQLYRVLRITMEHHAQSRKTRGLEQRLGRDSIGPL